MDKKLTVEYVNGDKIEIDFDETVNLFIDASIRI